MSDSVSIKSDDLDDIKFDLNEIAKGLLSYNEIPDDKIKHILLYSKMMELNNKLVKFNGVLDEFLEIIHKIEKHMFENDQKKGMCKFLDVYNIWELEHIFQDKNLDFLEIVSTSQILQILRLLYNKSYFGMHFVCLSESTFTFELKYKLHPLDAEINKTRYKQYSKK